VCHRTVSGAPGNPTPNLPPSGIRGGRSTIIHPTVRCSTGLSGVAPDCPVCQTEQRPSAPTVVCNATVKRYSARLRAQKSEQALKAHRTVNSDCPVHHRTVWWPHCQKLQRSEPNGLVTWLAHRTVSSGAPDCPVRHSTEALTNGSFGGWGYKYPPTTTLQGIQVFSHQTSYTSSRLHSKT
jgi:hypothetical protein